MPRSLIKKRVIWVLCLSIFSISGSNFMDKLYPPGNWDRIIENQDFTSPLILDTGDDNTLIIGSSFHDISGDAIIMRNVSNVYIKDCYIYNIQGNGIVLRSTGGTDGVTIEGCEIHDTQKNGIIAKQNLDDNVDHTNLVIKDNVLYNNGSHPLNHGIYVQTQDAKVLNNEVYGSSGNGISIRSSGLVSGNKVWGSYKSCIRYFNDNVKGSSDILLIENNVCYLTLGGKLSPAIGLLWTNDASPEWAVAKYIIRFNTVVLYTSDRSGIVVESREFNEKRVEIYGNIVVNTKNVANAIDGLYTDYLSGNYISTSLDGFVNALTDPLDFHLTSKSPAVNFASTEESFPLQDIDGLPRVKGILDSGAYQFAGRASTLQVEAIGMSEPNKFVKWNVLVPGILFLLLLVLGVIVTYKQYKTLN